MTTPLMGLLLLKSPVDAYEFKQAALIRTEARKKPKTILLLAKIKAIGVRIV
jgi:hypothetical protein